MGEFGKGLCRCFRCDQYIVGDRFSDDGDGEQGAEGGVAGAATIEAEGELVEVGLQVLLAQTVIDAECPALQVGEDAMRPRQEDVRGHRSDDVWLVADAGSAPISRPAVGFGAGAGGDIGFDERMQAGGGKVLDRGQPRSARPAVGHLDGAGDEHLALGAPSVPTAVRIILAAQGDGRLVDFHQAGEPRAAGRHHSPAQLGAQQPGRLVRSQPQLRLQLQGGDAVGMSGHQIRRPEPDGQRQLRAVHHCAGGNRGLPAAAGALPGERLGRKLPALAVSARRAAEPVRPARLRQIPGTRTLVRKAALKLDQRAGKVGHGEPSIQDVRHTFYISHPGSVTRFRVAGASEISL